MAYTILVYLSLLDVMKRTDRRAAKELIMSRMPDGRSAKGKKLSWVARLSASYRTKCGTKEIPRGAKEKGDGLYEQ